MALGQSTCPLAVKTLAFILEKKIDFKLPPPFKLQKFGPENTEAVFSSVSL